MSRHLLDGDAEFEYLDEVYDEDADDVISVSDENPELWEAERQRAQAGSDFDRRITRVGGPKDSKRIKAMKKWNIFGVTAPFLQESMERAFTSLPATNYISGVKDDLYNERQSARVFINELLLRLGHAIIVRVLKRDESGRSWFRVETEVEGLENWPVTSTILLNPNVDQPGRDELSVMCSFLRTIEDWTMFRSIRQEIVDEDKARIIVDFCSRLMLNLLKVGRGRSYDQDRLIDMRTAAATQYWIDNISAYNKEMERLFGSAAAVKRANKDQKAVGPPGAHTNPHDERAAYGFALMNGIHGNIVDDLQFGIEESSNVGFQKQIVREFSNDGVFNEDTHANNFSPLKNSGPASKSSLGAWKVGNSQWGQNKDKQIAAVEARVAEMIEPLSPDKGSYGLPRVSIMDLDVEKPAQMGGESRRLTTRWGEEVKQKKATRWSEPELMTKGTAGKRPMIRRNMMKNSIQPLENRLKVAQQDENNIVVTQATITTNSNSMTSNEEKAIRHQLLIKEERRTEQQLAAATAAAAAVSAAIAARTSPTPAMHQYQSEEEYSRPISSREYLYSSTHQQDHYPRDGFADPISRPMSIERDISPPRPLMSLNPYPPREFFDTAIPPLMREIPREPPRTMSASEYIQSQRLKADMEPRPTQIPQQTYSTPFIPEIQQNMRSGHSGIGARLAAIKSQHEREEEERIRIRMIEEQTRCEMEIQQRRLDEQQRITRARNEAAGGWRDISDQIEVEKRTAQPLEERLKEAERERREKEWREEEERRMKLDDEKDIDEMKAMMVDIDEMVAEMSRSGKEERAVMALIQSKIFNQLVSFGPSGVGLLERTKRKEMMNELRLALHECREEQRRLTEIQIQEEVRRLANMKELVDEEARRAREAEAAATHRPPRETWDREWAMEPRSEDWIHREPIREEWASRDDYRRERIREERRREEDSWRERQEATWRTEDQRNTMEPIRSVSRERRRSPIRRSPIRRSPIRRSPIRSPPRGRIERQRSREQQGRRRTPERRGIREPRRHDRDRGRGRF